MLEVIDSQSTQSFDHQVDVLLIGVIYDNIEGFDKRWKTRELDLSPIYLDVGSVI